MATVATAARAAGRVLVGLALVALALACAAAGVAVLAGVMPGVGGLPGAAAELQARYPACTDALRAAGGW
jgi:hypothetical protein